MKKVLGMLLMVSTVSMSLYAYDQTDRIKDMQEMEVSMAQIQKGILYNNQKLVLDGVAKLKKASVSVEIAPKEAMEFSERFAKRQSQNIMKYADKIRENIEANHKHGAATNYANVLRECISCHNKIRKWH